MDKYIDFNNITKVFPGQKALDNVTFSIKKGEIHAIIGENGAGKSTLLNILHGVFSQTDGKVMINGEEINFKDASDALNFGIVKVHQEINVIRDMTVAENLFLGKESTRYGLINKKEMNKKAQELLDKLHCSISSDELMRNLTAGEKQMVAIAKALQLNADIISFDEPTASLSDAEVEVLFDIIRELNKNGITILYISHKMDEIFSLCDRASVLRDGKYIKTLEMKSATAEDVIQSMVGRDISMFAKRSFPSKRQEEIIMNVEGLCGKAFNDISFSLHKGEILGMFGLVGAGRTDVVRAIYGADKKTNGTVTYKGRKMRFATPSQAVNAGIVLISENRKEEGIIPNFDNKNNIAISNLKKLQRSLFVNEKLKYKNAVTFGKKVGLKPNDPDFMTGDLSGGNSQKVILARWLSADADIFIFDEPTKGIDIGAKAEIYMLMEQLLEEGKSIIMVSSELTEIMGMCDRILIMREGKIVNEIERKEFAEDTILKYAVGG